MNKPKVVVTRTQFENEMERLRDVSDLIIIDSPNPPTSEELKEKISGATALFAHINDSVNGEIMDAAGPSLRVIAEFGVGYDNVDVDKLQTKRSTDIWMQSQLLMDNDRDPTQTSLGYDDVPLPLHIETGERILLSGYEDTEVDVDDVTDSEDTYIEQQADNFIDFSDADPFSEGGNF